MKLSDLFKGKAKPFEIYGDKSEDLVRLIYRRFYARLIRGDDRPRAFAEFLAETERESAKGDGLKMKWTLPDYLRQELSAEEIAQFDAAMGRRRAVRQTKLLEVFPHCADEFSVNNDFIDAVFSQQRLPLFNKETRVFTIGSCFARNIARFLVSQDYKNVVPFKQAEDLNSPLSNAKMMRVATADEARKAAYIETWIQKLNPELSAGDVKKEAREEIERLGKLVTSMKEAEVLIITIGNTADFFGAFPDDMAPEIPVAPKFLAVVNNEGVEHRTGIAKQLKQAGAHFRLATYGEAKASIAALYDSVRLINPTAPCIITLSPVPIDSAIGIETKLPYSAIELDTISKSTLRTALFELFDEWRSNDSNVHYFPSFEIVRWIGANLQSLPSFGAEDAASRHVSEDLLKTVYRFFLRRFEQPAEAKQSIAAASD